MICCPTVGVVPPIDSVVVVVLPFVTNPRPHPNSPPKETLGRIKYSAPTNAPKLRANEEPFFLSVIRASFP